MDRTTDRRTGICLKSRFAWLKWKKTWFLIAYFHLSMGKRGRRNGKVFHCRTVSQSFSLHCRQLMSVKLIKWRKLLCVMYHLQMGRAGQTEIRDRLDRQTDRRDIWECLKLNFSWWVETQVCRSKIQFGYMGSVQTLINQLKTISENSILLFLLFSPLFWNFTFKKKEKIVWIS